MKNMFKYSNSKNVLVEYDLAEAKIDDERLKDRLAGMRIKLELAFDDKQTTDKISVKNALKPNTEPNLETKAKPRQSLSSKIKEEKMFVFEKWNIRKCDLLGVDAITTGEGDQMLPGGPIRLKLSGRFFQFGGLQSDELSIELSAKGLVRFILREEHYEVKIAIRLSEIVYTAFMFHPPFYAISFCLADNVVDIYLNNLKSIDRYDQNLKLDNKISSQIVVLVDMTEDDDESILIDKLHAYFANQLSSLNKDFNNVVGFLSPAKSEKLIAEAFRKRKSEPKEVTSFLNDYRMSQMASVESDDLSPKVPLSKNCKSSSSISGPVPRLYVGNIPRNINRYEFESIFQSFGKVRDINVITNPKSPGIDYWFGYVTYYDIDSALEACTALNGYYLCGRRLRVEPAKSSNYY